MKGALVCCSFRFSNCAPDLGGPLDFRRFDTAPCAERRRNKGRLQTINDLKIHALTDAYTQRQMENLLCAICIKLRKLIKLVQLDRAKTIKINLNS